MRKVVNIRQYDEVGRDQIVYYLKECESVADLGCNKEKIRADAIGYDIDEEVFPDILADFNDTLFPFHFSNSKYDGICLSHFLEHVIDTRRLLAECYDALREDGRIAIIVPDGETVCSETLGDSSNTHEMLFTPKTLKLYLENAGFKDVIAEYYERPYAYKQTYGIFAGGEK